MPDNAIQSGRNGPPDAEEDRQEGPPYLGPITEAALTAQEDGPPPLIAEWGKKIPEPGNYILLWAGAFRNPTGSGCLSWSSLLTRTHWPSEEPADEDEGDTSPPTDPDAAGKVERMLGPLAHASRIRIMQALYEGHHSSSRLSQATGLKGGNLYHHMRELTHARYVREQDGGYALTNYGRQLLLTMTCFACQMVEDRDDEGLVIGSAW
jgi:DNA-binding transcriptional ArsR family regulator